MPVDVDVRAVGGNDGEFIRKRLRLIMAVNRLDEVGDQPGEFAGLDFFLQPLRVIGLAVENVQRMIDLLLSFIAVRLQTGNHACYLVDYFA